MSRRWRLMCAVGAVALLVTSAPIPVARASSTVHVTIDAHAWFTR